MGILATQFVEEVRFAGDPLLEETGFELAVPRRTEMGALRVTVGVST
jgi:hypothetical protein